MSDELNMNLSDSFTLNYNFSFREISLLAKFFRKNQDKMPDGLESFLRAIENAVYNNLSLDQIREFYEK